MLIASMVHQLITMERIIKQRISVPNAIKPLLVIMASHHKRPAMVILMKRKSKIMQMRK